jgi:predicted DNA binding CopG/RHH family protein
MPGTKRKAGKTKSNMGLASKKRKPSSKTRSPSLGQTKTAPTKRGKSSSVTQAETGSSSSSSSKKRKTVPSGLSRRANSPEQTKSPWAGYDWETMPPISPEQAKTFRRVTSAEHERFKQGRGRPKKDEADKAKPITLRIEPSLLLWVKQVASNEGLPWQTYLKLLVKKGLEASRAKAASE